MEQGTASERPVQEARPRAPRARLERARTRLEQQLQPLPQLRGVGAIGSGAQGRLRVRLSGPVGAGIVPATVDGFCVEVLSV
jgi:hypothetical protein